MDPPLPSPLLPRREEREFLAPSASSWLHAAPLWRCDSPYAGCHSIESDMVGSCPEGVQMDLDDLVDVGRVASGEHPGDWQAVTPRKPEDNAITLEQVLSRQV